MEQLFSRALERATACTHDTVFILQISLGPSIFEIGLMKRGWPSDSTEAGLVPNLTWKSNQTTRRQTMIVCLDSVVAETRHQFWSVRLGEVGGGGSVYMFPQSGTQSSYSVTHTQEDSPDTYTNMVTVDENQLRKWIKFHSNPGFHTLIRSFPSSLHASFSTMWSEFWSTVCFYFLVRIKLWETQEQTSRHDPARLSWTCCTRSVQSAQWIIKDHD